MAAATRSNLEDMVLYSIGLLEGILAWKARKVGHFSMALFTDTN